MIFTPRFKQNRTKIENFFVNNRPGFTDVVCNIVDLLQQHNIFSVFLYLLATSQFFVRSSYLFLHLLNMFGFLVLPGFTLLLCTHTLSSYTYMASSSHLHLAEISLLRFRQTYKTAKTSPHGYAQVETANLNTTDSGLIICSSAIAFSLDFLLREWH